ncbi:MAG: ADP-ribosylation factor-like protein [Candidatus Heimdallarchaeota archaeon]
MLLESSQKATSPDRIKLRIAFVGLKEAGKTSIIKQLVRGDFGPTKPTMGFNVDSFIYRGISVRATDLGGQAVFIDAFWKTFIPQSEAIVFVVDATNLVLLHQAKESLEMCLSWAQSQPLLVVLANKQDLPRAISKSEVIRRFKLDSIPKKTIRDIEVFATSAKTGQGIHSAFDWLISNLTGEIELPRVHLNSILVYQFSEKDKIIPLARIQNDLREPEIAYAVQMFNDLKSLIHQVDLSPNGTIINDKDRMRYQTVRIEDPASNFGCLILFHDGDHPNAMENVAKEAFSLIWEMVPNIDSELVLQQIRPFLTLPEHLGWRAPDHAAEEAIEAESQHEPPEIKDDRLIRPSERAAREKGLYIEPAEERLIKPSERLAALHRKEPEKAKNVGFFTKLSVGERITAIEEKGFRRMRKKRR